jgi:hypothetical protein
LKLDVRTLEADSSHFRRVFFKIGVSAFISLILNDIVFLKPCIWAHFGANLARFGAILPQLRAVLGSSSFASRRTWNWDTTSLCAATSKLPAKWQSSFSQADSAG